jgi:hypothetical protein
MQKETLKQRDKRKLDLQLDEELEGTFPASDPLKITRFPSNIHTSVKPSTRTDAAKSGRRTAVEFTRLLAISAIVAT